jgi:excinuclease ABC subunit B
MEGAYSEAGESRQRRRAPGTSGSAGLQDLHDDTQDDVKAIAREIGRIEEQMYEFARNLDFEAAAAARDMVARLKKRLLQLEV